MVLNRIGLSLLLFLTGAVELSHSYSADEPHTSYLPFISQAPDHWQVLMEEDFEGNFPREGWSVEDHGGPDRYLWGKRLCRSMLGSHSAWAVGSGSEGSGLACDSSYPDRAYSWLKYGPFSLEGAGVAEVVFGRWHQTVGEGDSFQWLASRDGREYWGFKSWGDSHGWRRTVFDLSQVPELGDLRGEEQVWILFVFETDESGAQAEGAYVDEVALRVRPLMGHDAP